MPHCPWTDRHAADALVLLILDDKLPSQLVVSQLASFLRWVDPVQTVYCIGGRSGPLGDSAAHLCSVEFLDPVLNDWRNSPEMPSPRVAAAAVALDGYLYVMGGYRDSRGRSLSSVDRFDTHGFKWGESPPMLQRRYGHCACVLNGSIYVFGGEEQLMSERFDAIPNKWYPLPAPPVHVSAARCAVIDEKIVLAGGCLVLPPGSLEKANDRIYIFDPVCESWHSSQVRLCPARTAFGLTVESDSLLLTAGFVLDDGREVEVGTSQRISKSLLLTGATEDDSFPAPEVCSPRGGCLSVSVPGGVTLLLGGERETADYTNKLFDEPLKLSGKLGWRQGDLPRMKTARTAFSACAGPFWPECRRCRL